jgi:hypothetical protein
MTSSTPALRITTAVVTLCVLAFASAARAQEDEGFAKNGLFVGVTGVPTFTFDGVTFDGQSIYKQIDGDEIMLLPRLESKSTIRGLVGYRVTRGSFEVGYERLDLNATFVGLSGAASFHVFNFDERIYAFTSKRIQPYGLAGFSLPWLTVHDGSFLHERVGDGTYHGQGINMEAGATVFPIPRVGISAGYRYRVMWFDTASGVTNTRYDLHPKFRETAGNVSISAFVTF